MKSGLERQNAGKGFTIVETMIVLAITGLLFVMIATTLSGRQAKSEFNQAIQDARTQLQQVVSQVQAGFYANMGNFNCSAIGTSLTLSPVGSSKEQGSNESCVFLGHAVQLAVGSSSPEIIKVYPMAGIKLISSDLFDTHPTVIAPDDSNPLVSSVPDNSTDIKLIYNLKLTAMAYDDGTGLHKLGALAFLYSLGSFDVSKGDYNNGTAQVNLYALPYTSSLGMNVDQFTGAKGINSAFTASGAPDSAILNPSGGVKLCFQSGTTHDFGLVSLGDNGRATSSELRITPEDNCGLPT